MSLVDKQKKKLLGIVAIVKATFCMSKNCTTFSATCLIPDPLQFHLFCRYLAMTSVNEANGWYGGTLLGDQDESSEIYQHYAELVQVLGNCFHANPQIRV